ncbi:hypothetical protein EV356DRAFT_505714 [Viridothelium virens]|uniref:Aminopeptidase n=1 Tax=Viridothelium virens TaxID=1048519 RepID=A0A6A6H2P0_VIRVR|nr:hypothetical protein EV356DRAFT_505714 [Viridothelium virens]
MALDRDILPANVKPKNYDLSIYNLELGGQFSYHGTVTVDIEINQALTEITLNAYQLQIHSAELFTEHTKTESSIEASDVTYDEKARRATLHFGTEVPTAPHGKLTINFAGTINDTMAGFYRSKYRPVTSPAKSVPVIDGSYYMFSTQFESSDARRVFPCWDEPNLKATFDVTIELPEDQIALSNMPEKSSTRSTKKAGYKEVKFERTPVMSTYLLAWAVGDFECVEGVTKREYREEGRLPVRVWTTRGLKEQGRWALGNACQIVDYFSEIFHLEYPLPKVDLLAVHEFSHGAMENWGLITYRTTAVLFDEVTSDQKFRRRVAYVVAHELAHQWFGNLVTMDWWNELWLNEGFATWVGWFALDHLYPDWSTWANFITDGTQVAFGLDSLRNSHPIEVPVRDALEVDQIFDHISYLKGSSVIRMLAAHLGVETFLKGVSDYLKAHTYGNATTNDLWVALAKASGKDVSQFMDAWIRKIGFPVVTVAEEPGQIGVEQSRFLLTGDVKAEEDQTTWWIPLELSTGDQAASTEASALTSKEETIRNVNETFYKFNKNQTGFYRTNYPPARLAKLGQAADQLSIEDRIGLIGDAAALAKSGHGTTAAVLAFLDGFRAERHPLVWAQLTDSLSEIRSIFSADDDHLAHALRAFTLRLVSPAAEKVGWEFTAQEDFLTGQLRANLLSTAGACGHEAIVAEAQRRFEAYRSGDQSAVHPSLRRTIFDIAVREGGEEAYERVRQEYLSTTSIDGKEAALYSLGRVQTPELAKKYLEFLFSPAVATQDVHSGGSALAANGKTRQIQWEWIKEHWDMIRERLGGNMVVLDRFVRLTLRKFADEGARRDIEAFFEGKDNKGYDRTLGVVADTIKGNASYRERDREIVREWLAANGYL